MTNVPDNIREIWTDVYKLFDLNYLMQNDKASWDHFWEQAIEILTKHNEAPHLMDMISIVVDMICDRMQADGSNPNRTMKWEKGEPYPYPKEGEKP